jgi:MFS family permease
MTYHLGPPLAGAILKHASWPWLFYVNLPIGILAVALAAIIIPHDESMIQKRPFDLFGFLTLSPACAASFTDLRGSLIIKAQHSFEAPFMALILFQLLVFGSAIQLPKRIHREN